MSDKEGGLVWLADFEVNPNGFLRVVRIYSCETGKCSIRKGRFGLASSLRSKIICVPYNMKVITGAALFLRTY
jgi:hypothetical protein